MEGVIVRVSIVAVIKHYNHSNWGAKGFSHLRTLRSHPSLSQESLGRKLEARAEAETLGECCLLVCFLSFVQFAIRP